MVTHQKPILGAANGRRLNVVLIITDDQGYGTVGVHGNQHVRTPNMDRLATEGVEFTRFYCNPLCSPTRASLLTGRYCYRTGILHTSRGGAKMSGEEVTVAELFHKAGYRTGLFGKWHLGDNYPMRPMDQGFDTAVWHKSGGIGQTPEKPNSYFDSRLYRNNEAFDARGYCTDVFFDEALEFIEQDPTHPFFIYLATNAPHDPLEVSDRYADPYREMGLDESTARVYGMVENIDDNVGRLLNRLDALGLDEDTMVIFMSDHGPASGRYNAGLRDSKGSAYEGGIRVPFFLRSVGRLAGGRKIDRIAAHIDLLPTLIDLCDLSMPDQLELDGVSLTPLLVAAPTSWPHRTLCIQTHRGSGPRRYQNSAVISQQYKLLTDPGTGGIWTYDIPEANPRLELYDIEKDPGEQQNLADEKSEVVAQLLTAYDGWFDDVTDNFQRGIIHIGNPAENPITLCRYQDSDYHGDIPVGWRVRIERDGRYEVQIRRSPFDSLGTLGLEWQGETQRQSLKASQDCGQFNLSAGCGVLQIWFELENIGRITFSSNQTIGDVQMRWFDV